MTIHEPEDSLVTRLDLAVYLKTPLTLGELLATRPDLAVYKQPTWCYNSLVIRRAGQTDDKAQGPEGRFTFNDGPV